MTQKENETSEENRNETKDADEAPAAVVDSSEAQIDDEGQSHNIDSAVQYAADDEDELSNRLLPQDINYVASSTEGEEHSKSSTDEASASSTQLASTTVKQQPKNRQIKIQIESEKVDLIEIKSDGSTGHLIPREYS